MSILRKAGTTAVISVAGAGIALGGIGMASASEDGTSAQDSATQNTASAADASSTDEGRGHGRGHRGGSGERAAELATALDLDESDVTAALKAVRDDREPKSAEDGTRTRPTEAQREARRAEMASALADELGISEQKVTEAMDSLAADRKAEGNGKGHGRRAAADKSAATS
ncbi:hypothetical protein C6I20_07530 [Aeromicrobium sp. A1-2]|uniref:hypothetical protein n=1 Tax=Aeromicrobium sp. A1-2 TaxID=2107713 RepID=UPI000E4E4534|nr:hypothetical protein [Aeromicrobium sp. A1-2]AXT85051.1 hypothetical protein C6I20_07530 [Aeromicrobium sp. A1-2]